MVEIKSERAKMLLKQPRAIEKTQSSQMKRYPGADLNLWVHLEREHQNVKKLSFFGSFEDYEAVLLESVSALLTGRPVSLLENLTLRECEAYLRDRNSEFALDQLSENDEARFKKLFQWMRGFPEKKEACEYQFDSKKGPFRELRLVDKIRELKAFFNSYEIQKLYEGLACPELVDVEELTIYIHVPYLSERDRALFEELHVLGVAMFQEESLNFIPEA